MKWQMTALCTVWLLCQTPMMKAGEAELPKRDATPEQSSPLYCALRNAGGYDVALSVHDKQVKIKFDRDGHTVFEIDGHSHTVFAIRDHDLWYVKYSDISSGGTVVCVDMQSGDTRWSTRLEGLPASTHSMYDNKIVLHLDVLQLTVYGHETYGRYIETLDARTGKTLQHEILAVP